MSTYRLKNVVDAVQFTSPSESLKMAVNVNGNWVEISTGDWIINDASSLSVMKNELFSGEYEAASA